jgi:hypothetical protein
MNENRDMQVGSASPSLAAPQANGRTDGVETVMLAGGAALVIFGAGLIMAHPSVRKLAVTVLTRAIPDLEKPLQEGLAGLLPDVERYMKIRSM